MTKPLSPENEKRELEMFDSEFGHFINAIFNRYPDIDRRRITKYILISLVAGMINRGWSGNALLTLVSDIIASHVPIKILDETNN